MKLFHCGRCANLLYFENSRCTQCGADLGFAPDVMDLLALEPSGGDQRLAIVSGDAYRLCGNYQSQGVCNWLIPVNDYDLRGKRVAVIGTGASAIQFVPEVAKQAARLDLYQRIPPWIMPKPDRAIRPMEKRLFRMVPQSLNALRQSIYWTLEARVLGFVGNPRILKLGELQARRHIRSQIKDRELRKKVTPDFHFGCKRVLISNNYYPALAQDHVDVVTDGIREVKGNVIVDGQGRERQVDCIIYGTGFKAQDPIPAGMIFGRNGQDLLDAWKDGAEAYKGTAIHGFPNFFMLMGPNTGLGHSSMVYMIESQIQYVLDALKQMDGQQWASVEVKQGAQSQYNASIHAKLGDSVWQTGCKSWYVNENGKNTTLWPGFTWQFRQQTRRFDAAQFRVSGGADVAAEPALNREPALAAQG